MEKMLILFFILLSKCLQAQDLPIKQIKQLLNLTQEDLDLRGKKEILGFINSKIWQGGYFEGNPLDPFGISSYPVLMPYQGQLLNPLYICYLECIKPFINPGINVLEIGPGKGAWTKCILKLNPKSLICVDAFPADYNNFWNYIGNSNITKYVQIKDFLLNEIEDSSINFVFSFGTFCHISSLMCYEYFKNLFKKLKTGAQGFIMYADFYKKNKFANKYNLPSQLSGSNQELTYFQYQNETGDFRPIWYHLGIERAEASLKELGYEVIGADIGINERDPIIHFRKPQK